MIKALTYVLMRLLGLKLVPVKVQVEQ